MMKFYIGYYNEPWNKSNFTVICGCPNSTAANFIFETYKNSESEYMKGTYEMITAAEAMNLHLIF